MWYGEYKRSLDAKDRFVLPAKFRDKLKQLENKKFFVTRGLEGCLFIFAYDEWKRLETKLKEIPFTKQQSRSFNRLYFSGAQEIEFDSRGDVMATIAYDGNIRLWDPDTGILNMIIKSNAYSIAFSPDGLLTSGTRDGLIYIWDPKSGQQLEAIQVGGRILDIGYSPDGNHLMIMKSTETQIRVGTLYDVDKWDTTSWGFHKNRNRLPKDLTTCM